MMFRKSNDIHLNGKKKEDQTLGCSQVNGVVVLSEGTPQNQEINQNHPASSTHTQERFHHQSTSTTSLQQLKEETKNLEGSKKKQKNPTKLV